MKVQYTGRRPREVVPFNGERTFHVAPGDVVSVSNVVGASLLDQVDLWQPVKTKPDKDED